jgi:hypothetical protein
MRTTKGNPPWSDSVKSTYAFWSSSAETGVNVNTVYRWWAEGRGPKSTRLEPRRRIIAREDAEAWRRVQQD